jgi:hypothetical protein
VFAIGGAVAAAARAITGRRTAAQLGSFLGRAAEVGLNTALEEQGLGDLVGRDPLAVLAALVDLLAGDAEAPEAAANRDALIAVLQAELFEAATYEELELLLMDSLDATGIVRLLELFIVEYIYRRICQELGKQLEAGAQTPADLPAIERDLRAYIVDSVALELANVNVMTLDWASDATQKRIEGIFASAYGQIS